MGTKTGGEGASRAPALAQGVTEDDICRALSAMPNVEQAGDTHSLFRGEKGESRPAALEPHLPRKDAGTNPSMGLGAASWEPHHIEMVEFIPHGQVRSAPLLVDSGVLLLVRPLPCVPSLPQNLRAFQALKLPADLTERWSQESQEDEHILPSFFSSDFKAGSEVLRLKAEHVH